MLAVDIALILFGVAALHFGSEWLVSGASTVAKRHGLSPMLIGLTIVAAGTSLPEFVVVMLSTLRGTQGLGVGNLVGSNIANVALVLGAAAVISPIFLGSKGSLREISVMLGALVAVYALAWDGVFTAPEGIVVILIWMGAIMIAWGHEVGDEIEESEAATGWRAWIFILGGLIALAAGAESMVRGGSSIARAFGVSDWVIGITIVAVGTSLPELATTVRAVLAGQTSIGIGNVVGSNLFNLLVILGAGSFLEPVVFDHGALWRDYPFMLAINFALIPILLTRGKMGRGIGLTYLAIYSAYTIYVYIA